jgi:hypothetical protein
MRVWPRDTRYEPGEACTTMREARRGVDDDDDDGEEGRRLRWE